MKLLLAARHSGYLRHFAGPIRDLHERGHEVVVVLGLRGKPGTEPAERLAEELAGLPRVSFVDGVDRIGKKGDLGVRLRAAINHLRYLEPPFAGAEHLRARAGSRLPAAVAQADLDAAAADPGYPARQRALLAEVERRLPIAPAARELVARIAPDALAVTPLIERGEPQLDYLRAARELGIPRAVLVASWDNLTTGGLLHDVPDRVVVWNDAQRREAVELMGIPEEQVTTTGAAAFDAWFGREPSRDRAAFCAAAGLADDRPYVLYLGSSGFIAPQEGAFVAGWLERLRRHRGLRDVGVMIRPHPFNPMAEDQRLKPHLDERTVLHPRDGTIVVDAGAQDDYFDALHHASAVVGVNTSGLIEAAIAGRPVLVPAAKRYRAAQKGSPHFAHLVEGGLAAPLPMAEHLDAVAAALDGAHPGHLERFVEAFVRPFGLDEPASPRVASALEELATLPAEPAPPPAPPGPETLAALASLLAPGSRSAPPVRGAARAAAPDDASTLLALRRRTPIRVDQPLVLIGQLQRSGGTMLNALLDGHRQVLAHAYELHIGWPSKSNWPVLDLDASASEWLAILQEPRVQQLFEQGYRKGRRELRDSGLPGYQPLPFLLPPAFLDEVFLELAEERVPTTPRDVLDLYFSAYHTAWLDGPARVGAPARWLVGFGPRMGWEPSRQAFFTDYPDGRLLMVVRDPRAWYASAAVHTHVQDMGDFEEDAVATWARNAGEARAAKAERPGQVFVLTHDALALRTDETMRALAAWLEIEWDPLLTEPTFNGQPIAADTSFEPVPPGVRPEVTERWRSELSSDIVAEIEDRTLDVYRRVVDEVADAA